MLCAAQGDDFMHKEGVGNFRTLRLLGDGDGDDSSSSSDDDDNVTSLHIPQDLILKASTCLLFLGSLEGFLGHHGLG